MASVTYEHVTKRFTDDPSVLPAVKDLDIHIEDQEFLVFVGPSGCGKSTSLRMLAGLEEVTEGTVRIGERVVNDVPPKDRDIAMVFQSYALYPHMSVFDNMAFSLKLRRVSKAEIRRQVHKAAEILGIEELLDRKPKQLSGGQRQRVAVGRAIVREPAVFLMDEPLSNLDAKLRVQARAEISKLHKRLATTFIYVTHDQVEAMTMGTRIAVLKDGLLQQVDSPQTLYDLPANMFVAGFIGSPSMNFFDATLLQDDGNVLVDTGAFRLPLPDDKAAAKAHLGQPVVLGVRPEDIHDASFPPPGIIPFQLEGQVEVTELMGNEVFVYLNTDGQGYIARVDPRTSAHVGNTQGVVINTQNVHLFDREAELAIR